MNKFTKFTKPLWWLMSLLMIALVAGCSSGSDSSAPSSAKAITAYSLAGVAGVIDETAKTITVGVPYGTNLTTLVATFTTTGASVKVNTVVQISGTTANNLTNAVAYLVTAADGSTASYIVTAGVARTAAKAITAFSVAGVAGTINETARTISVNVPYGTNVAALAAAFKTTAASVMVNGVTQTTGISLNNLSSPVIYTVVATDNTTAIYTVTVTVAANFAKSMTTYSLAGVAGVIDETNKAIAVTLPNGTNVTALVATFTHTGTGSLLVVGLSQVSGNTQNNFTYPVDYTVTAADLSTATYTVTVTVAHNADKAVTAYSLNSVAGTIDENAKTITVTMPNGTNVTALVASFTTTGAGVKVNNVEQTSGTTANNFTSSVPYIVTAADTTTATYTVSVVLASGPVVCTQGASCVDLGTSANYAAFSDSAIDTAANASTITGNIGVGPGVTSTAITGFALTLPPASPFSTSALVSGKVYAHDYANPTPADVTTASGDMGAAYTAASLKTSTAGCPGTGAFDGTVVPPLAAGVYTCAVAVTIPTNFTLNGSATDVWVFQITGTLDQAVATQVILTGGALPQNVFWQVSGAVNVLANAHFEGVLLGQTSIAFGNLSSVKGRLLAHTGITLNQTAVVQP